MVDLSWAHILVVVVVALVVVGPKDLPRLMRTAGRWAGKARTMADQFRKSFDEMARQSELDELRNEVNRLQTETIQQPMSDNDYLSFGIDPDTLAPRPESPSIQPPPKKEEAAAEPTPTASQS